MKQVAILDGRGAGGGFSGGDYDLDVAAARKDGKVILGRVRGSAGVGAIVALRSRDGLTRDDRRGTAAGERRRSRRLECGDHEYGRDLSDAQRKVQWVVDCDVMFVCLAAGLDSRDKEDCGERERGETIDRVIMAGGEVGGGFKLVRLDVSHGIHPLEVCYCRE